MKQLSTKVMRFRILGEKYIVCNLSLGQCSWGQFSSEELCRQQIIWKAIFLRGNFQRDIVKGQLYLGLFSVSNNPGDNYQPAIIRRQFCSWAIVHGAIILGGNCPGWNNLGGQSSRGQLFGGQFFSGPFVRTPKNFHLTLVASRQNQVRSHLGWLVRFSYEQIIIL